jgi:hypothetical protein
MSEIDLTLRELATALNSGATYERLIGLLRQLDRDQAIDPAGLALFFDVMLRLLAHQDDTELLPGYSAGAHIRACALDELTALMAPRPFAPRRMAWDAPSAERQLEPFLRWLGRFAPNYHLEWKVFTGADPAVIAVVERWIGDLERQGARSAGYLDGLKRAIELEGLNERIRRDEVAWAEVQPLLLPLLDHEHFMLRAAAAKCIGTFYPYSMAYYPQGIPPFIAMLDIIGGKEIERSGVLGPFIDGYDGDCCGIHSLEQGEEVIAAGFDVSAWILDILARSGSEVGGYMGGAPNAQSLEFYAHEYFEANPAGIRRLISMGRLNLACDAATNIPDRVDGMEDVLTALAQSPDPVHAEVARRHLSRYYQG